MVTLVLKQDVKGLGKRGDVVTVKPGYAHNFLLPKKLAVLAKVSDIELFEKRKEFKHKTVQEKDTVFANIDEIVSERIKKRGLMIRRNANAKGVLYDKVDKKELLEELLVVVPELDVFHVDVKLDEAISKLGKHAVDVLIRMEDREKLVTVIVDVVSTQKQAKMKYSEMKKKLHEEKDNKEAKSKAKSKKS